MPKIPKVILLIEASRTCGRGLLLGIAKYSRLHGPWAFYRRPLFYLHPDRRKKALSLLKNSDADGIIMDKAYFSDTEIDRAIISMGLPAISTAIEAQIPGLANILTDNVRIARMAAEHLLERGFRHFAYCGFDDIFWSKERSEVFAKRVAQAGFRTSFYKQPKSRVKRLWENEQNLVAEWLKSLPKPVGLMACNDDRGQEVIEACNIAGLHVPDEVAIVGVDDDRLICGLTDPSLSSIPLNFERAGYEAAELLDKLMAGEKLADHNIIIRPTHIVSRQSTDILAIDDREVAAAVHFIRQHASQEIHVGDVVNAVTLSRRVLEKRFRRILGRSVHEEIRRVRVGQVARMLVETNLSVSRIALALGYPGVDHIARYFRREKEMSLLAYRKKYGGK